MTFRINGKSVKSDEASLVYRSDQPFLRVLKTLPGQSVPDALVMVGILTKQLEPKDDNVDRHVRFAAQHTTEAPATSIPPETVRAIAWLLNRVSDSLSDKRKEAIGTLIETAGLNTPGESEQSTDTVRLEAHLCQESPSTNSGSENQSDQADVTTERTPIDCEFCGTSFRSESALRSHWIECNERPADARFECPHCNNEYISEFALGQHRDDCDAKPRQRQTLSTSDSTTYSCDHCDESFDSRHRMKEHEYDCSDSKTNMKNIPSVIKRGASGSVVHYDEDDGFGFIATSDLKQCSNERADTAEDIYFHITDYVQGEIEENDRLEFDIIETEEGPRAVNITPGHQTTDQWDETFASSRPTWAEDT